MNATDSMGLQEEDGEAKEEEGRRINAILFPDIGPNQVGPGAFEAEMRDQMAGSQCMEPGATRLPRDANVNPRTPDVLPRSRPISLSPTQNARIKADIDEAERDGAVDFRLNQQQVDVNGIRVGINRPDLQYTDGDGNRVYVEYDTDTSSRGAGHETRIKSNDPSGRVILIRQN